MIKMVFDNLISFAKGVDFQDTSICTEWKSVKKYEDRDNYPNYDYFPHSVLYEKSLSDMEVIF
ncbi:MAG: hypothetical protein B2I18_03860 [Cuniculiplasma sp. C_DKE]|nr:MAG: hypothetical protein B2I18_03860 [Cuniculiplasma sp. C_DKE]